LFMSQYDQPYIPPSSMVYPLEVEVEAEVDLISFNEDFEFEKQRNSSAMRGQVDVGQSEDIVPTTYLNPIHYSEGKPQMPDLETGQKAQRIIATPRRKFQADEREKTAQTRKYTACVRCRMQRIRVRSCHC